MKGVANAQPSGATIAGCNDSAYWSYGLEQSFNSPVSKEAAHRYITALNALLEGPKREKHRLVVGNTTVAFWTERPTPTEDVFVAFAAEGSDALASELAQDEAVRAKLEAFLKALRQGRQAYAELEENPEGTGYFILGLAAPTPA
ncbi:type I-C CRISPR-associated protein Cas8c/Csd1, partial [Thermoanaerobaculum aquaticum]|uniref:type I-C CRISPR-associated protein Cas8c/Csd1 n=1 Tax=Thermoanaerobaculum aquaticum TaxID=1312852 RepID=UPI001F265928